MQAKQEKAAGFYFYLSLWFWLVVVVGFGSGFVGERPDPTVLQNPVVHLHVFIFVGWLFLTSYQMWLPSRGRTADHQRLGKILAAYGVVIVLSGFWVALSRFTDRLDAGLVVQARINLLPPFSDVIIFPIVFGLALAFRHNSQAHKRLMLLACCLLTIPGVARLPFLGAPPNVLLLEVIWLLPMLAAIARDLWVDRRMHIVFVFGLLLMPLLPLRMALVDSSGWVSFTNWLAQVLG